MGELKLWEIIETERLARVVKAWLVLLFKFLPDFRCRGNSNLA